MVYLVLPTTIYAYTSNNNYRLISVSELATIHLLKYPTTSYFDDAQNSAIR